MCWELDAVSGLDAETSFSMGFKEWAGLEDKGDGMSKDTRGSSLMTTTELLRRLIGIEYVSE